MVRIFTLYDSHCPHHQTCLSYFKCICLEQRSWEDGGRCSSAAAAPWELGTQPHTEIPNDSNREVKWSPHIIGQWESEVSRPMGRAQHYPRTKASVWLQHQPGKLTQLWEPERQQRGKAHLRGGLRRSHSSGSEG